MKICPFDTYVPRFPEFPIKWYWSFSLLDGERKWILVWVKVSDVDDSHLWDRLLGFKCETYAKAPHHIRMEEMLDL